MGTSTPQVHRPVVPRNDGTGLGDYLLETQKINKIAVDHSNRKWIATETSGVYLVSADGTEIIANYTAENSALPPIRYIPSPFPPTDNVVYFGTANGLASFDSDSSPAADDYTEVYAYPNPVRPDYTGWITIAGLMDDSLGENCRCRRQRLLPGTKRRRHDFMGRLRRRRKPRALRRLLCLRLAERLLETRRVQLLKSLL